MATQVGFLEFIRSTMQISSVFLPDNSPVIEQSYAIAIDTVSLIIQQASGNIYDIAVYNLAGDLLINYAEDQPTYTFFEDLRTKYGCNGFTSGVVSSSSDASTSQSLAVPTPLNDLTISDLQRLKTKYGRTYLEIAQRYSMSWGLS